MANDPKTFRFPKQFTLFGHKYQVEFVSDLYHTDHAYGYIDDDTKLIRIQSSGTLKKEVIDKKTGKSCIEFEVSDTLVLETFFHEMVHAILYSMDQNKLSANEAFVGMFGKALLEIYLTSEYEEKNTKKRTRKNG